MANKKVLLITSTDGARDAKTSATQSISQAVQKSRPCARNIHIHTSRRAEKTWVFLTARWASQKLDTSISSAAASYIRIW